MKKYGKFFNLVLVILFFTFIFIDCSNGSTDNSTVKQWYEGIWNNEGGHTQMIITGTSFVSSYDGVDNYKGTIIFNEGAGTFHMDLSEAYDVSVNKWLSPYNGLIEGNYTRITEDQMKFEGTSVATDYAGVWTRQ